MEPITKSVNLFKALGDNTRLQIVNCILNEEKSVNVISKLLNLSQSAISHQLQTLKLNGIVKSIRRGKEVYYSLEDDHIKVILEAVYNHTSCVE